jgi:hypothetical protein
MNDEMEQGIYPFSIKDLEKGSVFTVSMVEHAYSVQYGTSEYSLAALRASQFISERFKEERGVVVTTAIRKDGVRILTDEEAVAANAKTFRSGLRRARKAHVRQLGSDRSLMSAKVKAEHDRRVEVEGRILSSITKELRRQPQALPVERVTPLPPGVEVE